MSEENEKDKNSPVQPEKPIIVHLPKWEEREPDAQISALLREMGIEASFDGDLRSIPSSIEALVLLLDPKNRAKQDLKKELATIYLKEIGDKAYDNDPFSQERIDELNEKITPDIFVEQGLTATDVVGFLKFEECSPDERDSFKIKPVKSLKPTIRVDLPPQPTPPEVIDVETENEPVNQTPKSGWKSAAAVGGVVGLAGAVAGFGLHDKLSGNNDEDQKPEPSASVVETAPETNKVAPEMYVASEGKPITELQDELLAKDKAKEKINKAVDEDQKKIDEIRARLNTMGITDPKVELEPKTKVEEKTEATPALAEDLTKTETLKEKPSIFSESEQKMFAKIRPEKLTNFATSIADLDYNLNKIIDGLGDDEDFFLSVYKNTVETYRNRVINVVGMYKGQNQGNISPDDLLYIGMVGKTMLFKLDGTANEELLAKIALQKQVFQDLISQIIDLGKKDLNDELAKTRLGITEAGSSLDFSPARNNYADGDNEARLREWWDTNRDKKVEPGMDVGQMNTNKTTSNTSKSEINKSRFTINPFGVSNRSNANNTYNNTTVSRSGKTVQGGKIVQGGRIVNR